ncbi:MAG TPA: hypothetical protein VMU19_07490 [Bryobacteraceae bacterium]|nr:hypothetical protein [Bryobacteraceae bacterium]
MADRPEPFPGGRGEEQGGRIDCVYLTCFPADFSFLASILYFSRIRLHRAETLEAADFLLTVSGATVLLTETTYLDGSWRNALEMLADAHPCVGALVAAEPVDLPYVHDAAGRGACGVLWKPLPDDRTVALIRTAHEASRNRVQLVDRSDALSFRNRDR